MSYVVFTENNKVNIHFITQLAVTYRMTKYCKTLFFSKSPPKIFLHLSQKIFRIFRFSMSSGPGPGPGPGPPTALSSSRTIVPSNTCPLNLASPTSNLPIGILSRPTSASSSTSKSVKPFFLYFYFSLQITNLSNYISFSFPSFFFILFPVLNLGTLLESSPLLL